MTRAAAGALAVAIVLAARAGRAEDAVAAKVAAELAAGKRLERQGQTAHAVRRYAAGVDVFDRSGARPGSPAAELAAEAQFRLAERVYLDVFQPHRVKWQGNITGRRGGQNVQAALSSLEQVKKTATDAYNQVARLGSPLWTQAATVRAGDVAREAAEKLVSAPPPKDVERLEAKYPGQDIMKQYRDGIAQQAEPDREEARRRWSDVVEEAERQGVETEWSRRARQRLQRP